MIFLTSEASSPDTNGEFCAFRKSPLGGSVVITSKREDAPVPANATGEVSFFLLYCAKILHLVCANSSYRYVFKVCRKNILHCCFGEKPKDTCRPGGLWLSKVKHVASLVSGSGHNRHIVWWQNDHSWCSWNWFSHWPVELRDFWLNNFP